MGWAGYYVIAAVCWVLIGITVLVGFELPMLIVFIACLNTASNMMKCAQKEADRYTSPDTY